MESTGGGSSSPQAWYAAPIAEFLNAPPEHVVGFLAAISDFDVRVDQREAWLAADRAAC
jgi:hypothetical protein